MAAGAVSLRKSHDIIILSFCNIVKGQANCIGKDINLVLIMLDIEEIFLNLFSLKCVLKLRDLRAGHVISYLLTKLQLAWLMTLKSTTDNIQN